MRTLMGRFRVADSKDHRSFRTILWNIRPDNEILPQIFQKKLALKSISLECPCSNRHIRGEIPKKSTFTSISLEFAHMPFQRQRKAPFREQQAFTISIACPEGSLLFYMYISKKTQDNIFMLSCIFHIFISRQRYFAKSPVFIFIPSC